MTRLAVTGHRALPEHTERLVDTALRAEVARHSGSELVGLSCIADGADALFARAVLDAGGMLIVVVPSERYRDGLPKRHHDSYDGLMARASDVIRLDHPKSDSHAHMDAALRMIEQADQLLAVWDGQPARGYGGTADVVDAASKRGVPVTVIWPEGAERD